MTSSPRRIVVGIDGSESSSRALQWAASEAGLHGDTLVALTAWTALPPPILAPVVGAGEAVDPDEVAVAAGEALRKLVSDAVAGHGSVETELRAAEGHPVELLAKESARADLVVVGRRGRSGMGWLLGSVSQELLRRSSCSVVIVRSHLGSSAPDGPAADLPQEQQRMQWHQVVVGVDGSEASRLALRQASMEAQEHEAALLVVMARDPRPVPIPGPYGRPPAMDAGPEPRDQAARALSDLVTEVLGEELALGASTRIVEGHPAKALIEAAEDADLLVVASRGLGGFAGLLLGSTSQHVVAHAHGTVLVVR